MVLEEKKVSKESFDIKKVRLGLFKAITIENGELVSRLGIAPLFNYEIKILRNHLILYRIYLKKYTQKKVVIKFTLIHLNTKNCQQVPKCFTQVSRSST